MSSAAELRAGVFDVLVRQLGYLPADASRLITEALARKPEITIPSDLFDEIYRGPGPLPTNRGVGFGSPPGVTATSDTTRQGQARRMPASDPAQERLVGRAYQGYVDFATGIRESAVWPMTRAWALPVVGAGFLLWLLAMLISELAKDPWLPTRMAGQWGTEHPYVVLGAVAFVGVVLALVVWPITICVILVYWLGWFPGLVVAGLLFVLLLGLRASNTLARLSKSVESLLRSQNKSQTEPQPIQSETAQRTEILLQQISDRLVDMKDTIESAGAEALLEQISDRLVDIKDTIESLSDRIGEGSDLVDRKINETRDEMLRQLDEVKRAVDRLGDRLDDPSEL
jgi:hypothetical protein